MDQPDVCPSHRKRLSTTLAMAAAASAAALVLPVAVSYAEPVPPAPSPAPVVPAPPAVPAAPAAPVDPNAPLPPPDPNAPPAPPVDPNAPVPPPPPPPEPGRVDNAAGGFSYVVPAGWKVADATQLSYGQALLTKIPPAGTEQSPTDTSVLLGRLDLKLFAGAESDNTKAAARLASDMGEFFMPFPGTRVGQESTPLAAGDMTGAASYYEVKFTDATKPTGQIWAGVVGAPNPAGVPRGQRAAPARWFIVWLGTANHPVDKAAAVTLAQSIKPWSPPPPPAPDPNAPPPPPADPNAPAPRPGVGVPVPVTDAPPEMMPQG